MNAVATVPAPAPSFAPAAVATWPELSRDRAEGVRWYEALMAKAAPASGDAARFAAGL